jgi:hypothetical protein
METLDQKCGKTLITDNTTRWNSSYYMAKRVLELRGPVNDILAEMKIDSLLVAEWSRLEELVMLLEPFATQTDNLQSDTRLSLICNPFTVRPPVSSAIFSAL